MNESKNIIEDLSSEVKAQFQQQKVILTFGEYLQMLEAQPRKTIRGAAEYLRDTFDFFGSEVVDEKSTLAGRRKFNLFGNGSAKSGPIIGCEGVQNELYNVIDNFVKQGFSNKLILLHGPNGSAKSTTIDAISEAMHLYSLEDEGAVYKFNWIFPTEKSSNPRYGGESGPIGFSGSYEEAALSKSESYALLDESKISCKLQSEFRDNPVYLIPMPHRERILRKWIASETGVAEEDAEIPAFMLLPGLSKKNQLIYENLLAAYNGDIAKVMQHVQVERFFYSQQYRVGIATVEPQMSIDAMERQLTMDKNLQNMPSFLHNISFHVASGQLVEANRGIIEYSDMLKRPVEAYKYLLTTIERGTISLPSSTANLDVVFFATTNEKHLDAFKTMPDFSSFRSRFELITVPYLLRPKMEVNIYERDREFISKSKKIAPHTIELLCLWSVMTRLKQPDPEHYDSKHRALIARLDPRSKVALYEGETLQPTFKSSEESILRELRPRIHGESQGVAIYEGRFGASPREVRGILSRAAQNAKLACLTPTDIFQELRRLVRDKTVYEFLQFEPRGKYHDAEKFIEVIEEEFCSLFEHEILMAMTLVEDGQYDSHLQRYIDHAVAFVKKEKLYNTSTSSYEDPSNDLMKEVEKLIGVTGSIDRHRQNILGRIAACKIDNPAGSINVTEIFQDFVKKIQGHYHNEKRKTVDSNFIAMLKLGSDEEQQLNSEDRTLAETTYQELERRFGYDSDSARAALKFLMNRRKKTN